MTEIGDRIPLEPCPLCGGEQYERYECGTDHYTGAEYKAWIRYTHADYTYSGGNDPFPCIVHLARRLKELEARS
jgi:hypothetical protein